MSIRLRTINGSLVALCGAETDAAECDVYLDDTAHHALATKFARDWYGQTITWRYEDEDALAETQKKRDAVALHAALASAHAARTVEARMIDCEEEPCWFPPGLSCRRHLSVDCPDRPARTE